MSTERPGSNLTLEQLGAISPEVAPSFVRIEGGSVSTGYVYDFGFTFDHPHGPYIKIDTEHRSAYLTRGTEQQAQDALVVLAQQTRRRSGGSFDIHPFYGAVYGTKLTPVSPGFLTDSAGMDQGLSMIIYLTDAGDKFDGRLIRKALAIGTTVTILDPKANPNQSCRNQAIANGLSARWNDEFRRYNQDRVPTAMTLNPRNIVGLMQSVERDAGLTNLAVTRIHPER